MSLTVQPHRARCIRITDGTVPCQCSWYNAPTQPLLELNCVECGHGIHAHVDYQSKVVFHNPTTHCAAYAQKAHKSQACTCSVQLIDHEPIVNPYRFIALPHGSAPPANSLNSLPSLNSASRASGDTALIAPTYIPSTTSSDPNSVLSSAIVPLHSTRIPRFSQSDAYTFVSRSLQQSDDASVVHDFRASEGDYSYQEYSTGTFGAPYTGPYT